MVADIKSGINALHKISVGIVDPDGYTEQELKFLDIVQSHKVKMLDISPQNIRTQYGLEQLQFALTHHKHGTEYYLKCIEELIDR